MVANKSFNKHCKNTNIVQMSDALAHKLSDFKPRETEAKHVINLYRFFSLIGALTYPVFYFIFKYAYPESHDSFLLRVIISAMCFGIFFLSFSRRESSAASQELSLI